MAPSDASCARCRRAFPGWDSSESSTWEELDGRLVCESCVTRAENDAIAANYAEGLPAVDACARCHRAAPAESAQFDRWEVVDGEFLCPGCLTASERTVIAFEDTLAEAELRRQIEGESG